MLVGLGFYQMYSLLSMHRSKNCISKLMPDCGIIEKMIKVGDWHSHYKDNNIANIGMASSGLFHI